MPWMLLTGEPRPAGIRMCMCMCITHPSAQPPTSPCSSVNLKALSRRSVSSTVWQETNEEGNEVVDEVSVVYNQWVGVKQEDRKRQARLLRATSCRFQAKCMPTQPHFVGERPCSRPPPHGPLPPSGIPPACEQAVLCTPYGSPARTARTALDSPERPTGKSFTVFWRRRPSGPMMNRPRSATPAFSPSSISTS